MSEPVAANAPGRLLASLAGLALLVFILSLAIGPSGFGFGPGGEAGSLIFWEIRLPQFSQRRAACGSGGCPF